jgi:hypothetical protein
MCFRPGTKYEEIVISVIDELKKALVHLENFISANFTTSKEDNDNYKISIVKPLFIPINKENNLLAIKDFCLSVDLLLGDTYQEISTEFQQHLETFNST